MTSFLLYEKSYIGRVDTLRYTFSTAQLSETVEKKLQMGTIFNMLPIKMLTSMSFKFHNGPTLGTYLELGTLRAAECWIGN